MNNCLKPNSLKNMEPLTLRERQFEYLRILKELDRYCNVNHLTYYITCGTLIGAIRHKGFIPWDDDLDVMMPRPDFLRLCAEYQSNDFNFRNIRNDKSHSYNFGRLCSNRLYRLFKNKPIYNVGIDVYVINGAPSTSKEQCKLINDTFVHINRARFLIRVRSNLVRRGLWPFKNLNFELLNKELFSAERCFERYNYEESDFVWAFGGGKTIMKKELLETQIKLPFEDGLFLAPEHYHEVLSLSYGDYMQLPPEEMRHPYHGGNIYRI